MKRFAFAFSVTVLAAFGAATVFAQAKPSQPPAAKAAAAAQQAPAAPAKFVKPLKGTAEIQFMQLPSKKVGNDIVTVLKVKNLSSMPVALLKVDEYWYSKTQQLITGDSEAYRKPFMPGEIIEITMKSPYKADIAMSQYQFSHAGGKVDLKRVKKFD